MSENPWFVYSFFLILNDNDHDATASARTTPMACTNASAIGMSDNPWCYEKLLSSYL